MRKENRIFAASNLSPIILHIMEITGKIIAALPPRSGKSARTGNDWMSQEFVIETHDQYPRRCVFTVFGSDRLKEFDIQVGAEKTVSFDIDAHEYNGRWFNDIRAWRVVAPQQSAQQPVQAGPAAGDQNKSEYKNPLPPESSPEDDLPF